MNGVCHDTRQDSPFFSPLGVVFTNGASSSFLSFSALPFFSLAGGPGFFVDLVANFASLSSRFASFFAAQKAT
jgi:hypothetical protein